MVLGRTREPRTKCPGPGGWGGGGGGGDSWSGGTCGPPTTSLLPGFHLQRANYSRTSGTQNGWL